MKEYLEEYTKVMKQFQTSEQGLSTKEAEARLQKHGANVLEKGKKKSAVVRFVEELKDPMILILLAAAAISGITAVYEGESYADVIIILAVVLINAVLGVLQESKAEKAIEALQEIAAATSKVLRNGTMMIEKSENLVPGDIVLLEAGDAVPADGRILESASMKIEESALTGESVPVEKTAKALPHAKVDEIPLGDRKNMVYMGSTVVYGRGKAVITRTGMQTEMGKIAHVLGEAKEEETPLQKRLNQLSKMLSVLVIGICLVIFAVGIWKEGVSPEHLLDTFMVAVSLAVAAIPEGLAAVVTIVLSMGVTRMSRKNAVVRKLTAVETLGCTQVICSDKTGTLTQNKMTVVKHAGDDVKRLVSVMALCSDAVPGEDGQAQGEPTECALVNDAQKEGIPKKSLMARYPRIGEVPFDSKRKRMTTIHRKEDGMCFSCTKGAPDELLGCCTSVWKNGRKEPLTERERIRILSENKAMADQALRVIGAAARLWNREPKTTEAVDLEQDLCFLGLCGMIDPVREEVLPAIKACKEAGIRPVMITGDHKDTAAAIARELGILTEEHQVITGAELNALSEEELQQKIEQYTVYARVQPEHKVRIVDAWKKRGKVTAMTGDGVNDAPSIKRADIGIGMGITGTDVTKNVADMVLADDNFATIVTAVEEGRRIYANIRKAIQFLLASNLAEVLSIFSATMLGFTILNPVHLLWINLITDCFPALALGMEEGEEDLMKCPPRREKDGIFADGMGFDVIFEGIMITILTLASYVIGHYVEAGRWELVNSPDGMTMAFLTLSMVEIFHSFNMRSQKKSIFKMKRQNKYLWGAMALSFVLTSAVIYIPALSHAFGFEPISAWEYDIAICLGLLVIPAVEISKVLRRRAS